MSQSAANNRAGHHVQVTLNVYSGRKNPTWVLTQAQAASLNSILQELPAAAESSFFDGLGYRGFQVAMGNSVPGKSGELLVYKGKVRYTDGRKVKHLMDKDRRIERLLLKSGHSRIGPALSKMVEREIQLPEK